MDSESHTIYNLGLGRHADRTILERSVQEEILSDFRGTLRVVELVILVVVLVVVLVVFMVVLVVVLMLFLVVLAVVMVLVVVLLVLFVVSVVRYIGIPAGC